MLATLLALAAGGQAAAASAATAAPATMQQRFDAASEAAASGRCAEAIRGFEALEGSAAVQRNALLRAAVDVRKGTCLVRSGRAADGAASIRRGLPVLAAKGANFALDVRDARMTLGAAAQGAFDYEEAAREYRAAADSAEGTARVAPLLRLSQVTMFDRDGRALAAATEARTLALAAPGYSRKDVAAVQTQYARVLLNEGRDAEAYKELKNSLAKQGGLTNRVGASDIATRSDLAIAALRNRDVENARLYLAYTGAGRLKDAPFTRAASMDPPACGEGGIGPDDLAIVEFSLEEDGHVSGVAPIYTTGRRAAALAFARAVAEWSWKAEDAAKVPALFRYTTRVELRCSKASDDRTVLTPLREATETWIAATTPGAAGWADLSDAAALPLQRAALARARSAGDQAAIAATSLALANSAVTDREESVQLLDAAGPAAAAARAPVPVRTLIALRRRMADQRGGADALRRDVRAMLAGLDPVADALSAGSIRLYLAQSLGKNGTAEALTLYEAVATDAALPANHPLKVAALLGKANLLAAGGNAAAARAAFERTGLSAEQCAELGLTPDLRSAGASSADYPMAAVRMGFEGWVMAEADVTANGRTAGQRAVIAYPPFVFDHAAVGIARGARYASSFRPEGALACQGARLPIRFLLP